MFNFQVYIQGKIPKKFMVRGAYVFGHDDVPLPAEIHYADGILKCVKRSPGLGGLVLLWPVDGMGQIMLSTTRLEERQEPYNLNLELARSRLMRLLQKREDWGLFDFGGTDELATVTAEATDLFLEAMSTDDQIKASELADKSLAKSVDVADRWAKFCSHVLLERRIQAGSIQSTWMACGINPACINEKYRQRLREGFGHLYLPVHWRDIEPIERQFNWQRTDEWIDWLTKHRLPVRCGPLISLSARNLPNWIYLWENDFEGICDLMYEHVQRIVGRYGDRVAAWDVVSGINAENPFKFSFEQLIELARVAALATKRLAPRCSAIIEMVQPWGEYRANNMQTVPAAMFADMVVQSGVNFDALGVKLHFGIGRDGCFVRDFFQISSLLDKFASLGKPLHITGAEVPSSTKADPGDAWGGSMTAKTGGYWRRPWDSELQAEWLTTLMELAISKPFVESVCWSDLSDAHAHNLPHSGLLKADYTPKPAYKALMKMAGQYNEQRDKTK